jgi:hypothetical protein
MVGVVWVCATAQTTQRGILTQAGESYVVKEDASLVLMTDAALRMIAKRIAIWNSLIVII